MSEEWLIDGYNLLHAMASPATKSSAGRRERRPPAGRAGASSACREGLCAKLAGFAAQERVRVVLVLDGRGSEGELEVHRTQFFSAVHSQDLSADTWIEKRLCERKGRARPVVVTDDAALASMSRGTGARVMSTSDFLDQLKGAERSKEDTLFEKRADSHGFNRPFRDKL